MTSTSTVTVPLALGQEVQITTIRHDMIGTARCHHVDGPQSKPRFCGWEAANVPDADVLAQQHTASTGHLTVWSFYEVGQVRRS